MGESFLTDGNIGTIVAEPGSGKSPICESILANVLNNDCEALGFKVDEAIEHASESVKNISNGIKDVVNSIKKGKNKKV